MKQKFAFLFFAFCIVVPIYAQNRQEKADIVVMMDTSGTILPFYDDINRRVLNEINSKFVRIGDTIHIISFNAKARHELSQEVKSETDLSKIVSRFMLLYQLGQNSDLISAFDYAQNFTHNLKTGAKEKILIIISDGIFNPPKTSKYSSYGPEQLKNKISNVANDIRSDNWKVYFVKLPFPDNVIIKNLDGDVISGIAETAGKTGSGTTGMSLGSNTGSKESTGTGKNSDGSTSSTGIAGTGSDTIGKGDVGSGQNSSQGNNAGDADTTGSTGTGSVSGDLSKTDTSDWDSTSNEDAANGPQTGIVEDSYTDVSETVTDSLGIETSNLDKDPNKDLVINEDNTKLPLVEFPSSLEAVGQNLSLPLKITNPSNESVELDLESLSILSEGKSTNLSVKNGKVIIPPGETANVDAKVKLPKENFPRGQYEIELRLNFAENKAVLPQVTKLPITVKPTWFESFYESGKFWIAIAILGALLLLLLLLLFLYLRRKSSSSVSRAISDSKAQNTLNSFGQTNSTISSETTKASNDYAKKLAEQRLEEARQRSAFLNKTSNQYTPVAHYTEEKIHINRTQSGMTEIYVFNQNRAIGKRNIHVMKPGSQLSVGGGNRDDFIIFLVKFPANLASVRYDGRDYHLNINKPEYFPYVNGTSVNNCVGKTITAVSDKGYHVGFTFREYEDPISRLNGILRSIDYT
ncbi:MAG: VWA domain-containing protein [Treponemataceae bacterium]